MLKHIVKVFFLILYVKTYNVVIVIEKFFNSFHFIKDTKIDTIISDKKAENCLLCFNDVL